MPTAAEPIKPAAASPAADKPKVETLAPGVRASKFVERMNGGMPPKKPKTEEPPKAKEEPQKKEEPKPKEEAPKGDEKPKEEPPKKPAEPIAPPTPAFDANEIATAAAKGVASEFAKIEEAKKPKAPEVTDGLTSDEKETYEVLQRMEKDYSDLYPGHSAKYVESLKKAKDYETQWRKENPGKKFNPEDEDHNDFYAENDLDWKDLHFSKALARIESEKSEQATSRKENKEITELKRKDRMREEEPKIIAKRRENARTYFNALGEEYKGVIGENGTVNMAEVNRLVADDPLKAIVFNEADNVEAFSEAMYRLTNGLEEYDDKNPSHKFISDFVTQQEVMLRNGPTENQLNEKRQRFATSEEYAKMSAAQRAMYWRITPDDAMKMYAAERSKSAQEAVKAEEKRIEEIAQKRGFTKNGSGNTPPAAEPPKAEETPKVDATPPVEKPVSPSGTVEPRLSPPQNANGGNGQSKTDSFLNRWIGKS